MSESKLMAWYNLINILMSKIFADYMATLANELISPQQTMFIGRWNISDYTLFTEKVLSKSWPQKGMEHDNVGCDYLHLDDNGILTSPKAERWWRTAFQWWSKGCPTLLPNYKGLARRFHQTKVWYASNLCLGVDWGSMLTACLIAPLWFLFFLYYIITIRIWKYRKVTWNIAGKVV